MDVISVPGRESASLKDPVVEVEAVDMAAGETGGTVKAEDKAAVVGETSHSEYETDSDDSGEEWEAQSLYEDAIEVLKDEQLRDGGKILLYAPDLYMPLPSVVSFH
jgi:NAD-dependent histone deacetylase SIR2